MRQRPLQVADGLQAGDVVPPRAVRAVADEIVRGEVRLCEATLAASGNL